MLDFVSNKNEHKEQRKKRKKKKKKKKKKRKKEIFSLHFVDEQLEAP